MDQRLEKSPSPGRWPGVREVEPHCTFALFLMCWCKFLSCKLGGPVLGKVIMAAVNFY